MVTIVDFHTHSTASDGSLSPQALMLAALDENVEMMSLTDHDTVDGFLALREGAAGNVGRQPQKGDIQLQAGIEFSSVWRGRGIHVVGLNVDVDNEIFKQGVAQMQNLRQARAEAIAAKLAKAGITNILPAVMELSAGKPPCRPHFAQVLVNRGVVSSFNQAFTKYLGAGKLGNVASQWPELDEVIGWINASGGVAVLAHPEAYELTRTKLGELVDDFIDAGGLAIELAGVNASAKAIGMVQAVCLKKELPVSVGSDFHSPKHGWRRLGKRQSIPKGIMPIWKHAKFIASIDASITLSRETLVSEGMQ
jgi:predicted metal-dependent phosphoesterase TrpH